MAILNCEKKLLLTDYQAKQTLKPSDAMNNKGGQFMSTSTGQNTISTTFIDKMDTKQAVIAVIGLGYVGLPLIMGYHGCGYRVLGVDIDDSKISSLTKGESYIGHIEDSSIQKMLDEGRFEVTSDFSQLKDVDAILICVPTPLTKHREPDISFVVNTTEAIAPHLRAGQIVVLESTTYPGTTREVMQPILEQISGLKAGEDFIVAYSPEREDPGNSNFETTTISKVVGASNQIGLEMITSLYKPLVPQVVPVSSTETAEAVKLTENIFRAVNIALVNELKLIYSEMDIDVWEVIDAAATKPFGFMPFYPGPGLGGHCIPIDPFYLTWKARENGRHTRFIELAGEINENMPNHVITELAVSLSSRHKKALNGASVLVVGVAYKENVDDMRESPSLELLELLIEHGSKVDYYDPYIPVISPTRKHANLTGMKSIDWTMENIASYDAVIIATKHSSIDWEEMITHAQLVVDTRNASKGLPKELMKKVVKA